MPRNTLARLAGIQRTSTPWRVTPAAALAALLVGCAAVPPAVPPPSVPPPPSPAVVPAGPPVIVPEEQAPALPSAAELRTLQQLVAAQERLYRVAAPLLISNAALCRNHARNLLGFTAKNQFSYSQELALAAHSALGLDERLRVTGVLEGSGAARAGLSRGDVLLAVEGKEFPAGPNAEREAAALLAPLVADHRSLKLRVLRADSALALDVPLTPACAFSVEVGNTDLVNAYGDGHRILVTRGMLHAVRDDAELAYVLAKEMAHNILGHAGRQNQAATVGGIIDNLVRLQPDMSMMAGLSGLRPLPPEFEIAADRLAFYLLARANHRLEPAIAFWRRLATQYPPTQQNAYNALHPALDQRIAAMERALRDIRARRAAGRPLVPAQ